MFDTLLQLGLIVVVIFVLARRTIRDVPDRWKRLADVAQIGALALIVAYVAMQAVSNITDPIAWDFPVFYIVGKNAWNGVSFYDPTTLLAAFTDLQTSAGVPNEWVGELGFWYAPPTVLVLWPFGSVSFTTALIAQYLSQAALLVGAVWVVHRALPLRRGAMGMVEMGIVFMMFRPTVDAFRLAQIVFGAVLLTAVALVTIRRSPWWAGISLGVGSVFKHLLLIPAVLSLAMRRWRVLAGAVAAIVVAGIAAGLAFGFDVYREFATFGPSGRPAELALDPVIESLNGVLRRGFDAIPATSGAIDAILYPPYIVIAGFITVATLWLAWRASHRDRIELGFGLIVILSLIVYPNTLYNTLPIMVPVTALLVARSRSLPFPPVVTLSVVGVEYSIVATQIVPGFWTLAIAWTYLAVCLLVEDRRASGPPITPSSGWGRTSTDTQPENA